jgi:hypothetical protein
VVSSGWRRAYVRAGVGESWAANMFADACRQGPCRSPAQTISPAWERVVRGGVRGLDVHRFDVRIPDIARGASTWRRTIAFTYCLAEVAQRCEVDIVLSQMESNHHHTAV